MVTMVATAFAQTNLVENGDFESWTDGQPDNWKSACSASNATLSQSTDSHSGSYSVEVAGTTSANKRLAYKEMTLSAGTYTMTFYAKAATSTGGSVRPGYAVVTDGKVQSGNDYKYGDYINDLTTSSWTEVSHTFTLDASTQVCLVIMNSKKVGANVLIDDFTLTSSDVTPDPTPDPTPSTDISNTAETAYPVAKAHALIAAGEGLDTEVYVKGIITSVKSFNSSYGSITYYLGDTEDDANPIQIYGGLYLDGEKFSSANDLQVGDEIIVKGLLKSYNGTDEMDKNNVVISHKRDGKDVTPSAPTVDITNTPDKAYTVAEAIKLIDAGEGLTTSVYVKGYIVGTPSVSTSYGNATYKISDVKGDETTTLTIYRGKYLGNAKFTAEDQIAVDDEVIVYGTLTLYNSTYEMNSGNYLYSQNGNTTGIAEATNSLTNRKAIFSLDGRRLSAPVKGVNIINGKKVLVK